MIIDGKKIAAGIMARVAERVKELPRPPRVAAILVGAQKEMRRFLEIKEEMAVKAGFEYRWYEFSSDLPAGKAGIKTKELRKKLVEIARQTLVSGIILELPLPKHIDQQYVLNALPQEKDPDVLSQKAQGAYYVGRSAVMPPCAAAVKAIVDTHAIELAGKYCVVYGYGVLVGQQIAHYLMSQLATVTVVNIATKEPGQYSRDADLIVTGVGAPKLIKGDMVKQDAIVIDFGYGKTDCKLSGDVDFDEVSKKASLITPVPGGVGPLVCATALENILILNGLTDISGDK